MELSPIVEPAGRGRVFMGLDGLERLVPDNLVKQYDPEKGIEVLTPDYLDSRYDPETDSMKLVPRDYIKVFDPELGTERCMKAMSL